MEEIDIAKTYYNEKKTRKTFWHYTSGDALISIISNSGIRFSDCLFLNDIQEYHYIESLLQDNRFNGEDEVSLLVQEYRDIVKSDNEDSFLRPDGSDVMEWKVITGKYYVLSGSMNGDSLPMWNYYVKDGQYYGYAIRMDTNRFLKQAKRIDEGKILFGAVVYDRNRQIEIISENIKRMIGAYRSYKDSKGDDDFAKVMLENYFRMFIQEIRLFFKPEGFQHEEEYRVVLLTSENDLMHIGFSTQCGIVRPYMSFCLVDINPIEGIRLSPTIEQSIGIRGVKALIEKRFSEEEAKKIEIDKSNICVRF